MSKKAQILALHEQGHSTRRIAEIVYDIPPTAAYAEVDRRMAYVRVAIRQRGDKPISAADKSYMLKRYKARSIKEAWKLRSRERYADPDKRARHLACSARRRARRLAKAAHA